MTRFLKGVVTAAVLSVSGAAGAANLTLAQNPLWTAPAGTAGYPFLTIDNTHRGLAFNPTSGNVLVASRATGNTSVYAKR